MHQYCKCRAEGTQDNRHRDEVCMTQLCTHTGPGKWWKYTPQCDVVTSKSTLTSLQSGFSWKHMRTFPGEEQIFAHMPVRKSSTTSLLCRCSVLSCEKCWPLPFLSAPPRAHGDCDPCGETPGLMSSESPAIPTAQISASESHWTDWKLALQSPHSAGWYRRVPLVQGSGEFNASLGYTVRLRPAWSTERYCRSTDQK